MKIRLPAKLDYSKVVVSSIPFILFAVIWIWVSVGLYEQYLKIDNLEFTNLHIVWLILGFPLFQTLRYFIWTLGLYEEIVTNEMKDEIEINRFIFNRKVKTKTFKISKILKVSYREPDDVWDENGGRSKKEFQKKIVLTFKYSTYKFGIHCSEWEASKAVCSLTEFLEEAKKNRVSQN